MDELWQEALEEIRKRIGKQNFDAWIKPLHFESRTKNEICLDVPNKFFRDWLNEHFLELMEQVASSIARHSLKISLNVNQQLPAETPAEKIERKEEREKEKSHRTNNLIAKYTFENFVVGASNQFAHAASMAVANQPGDHYNPLFIYGGVGLGKTHLVNAIGHAVLERRPEARVAYLATDTFVNDLISSLRRDRMEEFKQRLRGVDLLIVDDIQALTGRERTQDEFFHTFNTLHAQRAQIVLTSDKVPKDISGLEERLRSRFEWGLIADLQPPDLETRVAILERKAELEGIAISHDVALFLADQVASNVRELEGALTRLGAHASLHRHEITLEYAREVMQTLRPVRQSSLV